MVFFFCRNYASLAVKKIVPFTNSNKSVDFAANKTFGFVRPGPVGGTNKSYAFVSVAGKSKPVCATKLTGTKPELAAYLLVLSFAEQEAEYGPTDLDKILASPLILSRLA